MLNKHRNLHRPTPTLGVPPSVTPPVPKAAAPTSTDLLTPSAVAALLRVSAKALERWRGTGDGPRFVRLTRKTIRYQLSDVEAFVAARLRSSTAGA